MPLRTPGFANSVTSTRRLRARPAGVSLGATRLGVGLAFGAQALGRDRRREQVAHVRGALLRQFPVRRIAHRADRLVVGVAGDEHVAGHRVQRRRDALASAAAPASATSALPGPKKPSPCSVTTERSTLVLDRDQALADLRREELGEPRASPRWRARRAAVARPRGSTRAWRTPGRTAAELEAQREIGEREQQQRERADDPQRQHVGRAAPRRRHALPVRRQRALGSPRSLRIS